MLRYDTWKTWAEAWAATMGGKAESRRAALERAFEAIRAYEESLSLEMLRVLNDCGAAVYGVSDTEQDR